VKIGCRFCARIEDVLEGMFALFRPKMQFYLTPKHFKNATIEKEVSAFFFNYMYTAIMR